LAGARGDDPGFQPVIEPAFELAGWGGIAEKKSRRNDPREHNRKAAADALSKINGAKGLPQ
jgi:hypothetical protein